MNADLRGKVSIVGIGATEQGEFPHRTAAELAIEALQSALEDAGLEKRDIDGLVMWDTPTGQGNDSTFGALAGLAPRYSVTLEYGSCNFSLHAGAMAIAAGMADTVAIVFGVKWRTGKAAFTSTPRGVNNDAVHGFFNVAGPAAMLMNRYRHLYGTTAEQLGVVPLTQREYAAMNPLAIQKRPLTMESYLASPFLVEPLRRPDICLISDGGVALILRASDRSEGLPRRPIPILGMMQQTEYRSVRGADRLLRPWMTDAARRFYADSGLSRDDVDLLYVQDSTSVFILHALEAYGFCGEGEAGPYLDSKGMGPSSSLPINTNGGELAESYMLGWLHIYEAVKQLRGECGERQIAGAEIAQFASTGGFDRAAATLIGTRVN